MATYKVNIHDYPFSEGGPAEEGWIAMKVQFLIDREHGGAEQIVFGRTVFAPGSEHRRHAHPQGEEFEYLTAGEGRALRSEGDIPVGVGDAWLTPMGGMHGFKNTSDSEVEMIWGWAGGGSKAAVGYRKLEDAAPGGGETFKVSVEETPYTEGGPPEEGWINMKVQWLLSGERGGATQVVFGRTVMAPGSAHEWHRHPKAEEFIYLHEGAGLVLNGEEQLSAREGDVWLSRKGEWHGFRNTSAEEVVLIWGWAGAATREAAGYEVRPDR